MTAEEALYWKNYIDRAIADKLSVLNSQQQDAVRIRQFADSYMGGITGQQLLPQSVFRKFLEMFSHIPATQGNIEQMQETLNETVESLQEAEAQITDKAENINNIEKVYYPAEADDDRNLFYHTYNKEWAEETLGDDFENLEEDDIIKALYNEFTNFTGNIHIVELNFPHRGIASCSYILLKYMLGGPNRIGVPKVKVVLLSYDGYFSWNVRTVREGRVTKRIINSNWSPFALQTETEQQRDVVVVSSFSDLTAIDEEERDTSVIYRTTDDDKLFLWNEEEFVEVGGESVDNTIYVTDLDQLFEMSLTTGVYNVAHNYRNGTRYNTTLYSLVVNNYRVGGRIVVRLILSYSDGWAEIASDENDNLYWEWHLYAYKNDVETQINNKIRKVNVNTQRSAEKKEVVEVASYAALMQISEPESEVIYVTLDEHKLYIYTEDGFVDATNGNSDNMIYVGNLNELIALELTSGSYQVCHTYQLNSVYNTDYYTLSVAEYKNGNETSRNLTLADINGWAEVVNGAWVWHIYSYREDVEEINTSEITALFTN